MAQYQVDSEQIQSSSAAVNASIQAIRQSMQGMYANLNNLQSVWRGGAATQLRWRNNGGQPNSRWSSRLNRFSMRFRKHPCSIRKPKCRRRVYSHSSGRCFRYGHSSSSHKEKRSLPPSWEAGSAYSFSLMPLGFTEPLDQ